ncbi:MAG: pilus assembly protein PilP [Hahellaceae bacterium]|nr:pilus assembly protein PilP [Hahellaceae bacterium]
MCSVLALTGCSGNQGFGDLDAFIAEVKARPKKPIEPLPEFKAYQAFTYSAASRRSPFAAPVEIVEAAVVAKPNSNVKPNLDRAKELLENFDLGSMLMVGTIVKAGDPTLYALVNDGRGGIHRVRVGQYLGKNHGRVTSIDTTGIQLVEIVSDGQSGWFERPRTMGLKEVN